jgi:YD repeat-containing protein
MKFLYVMAILLLVSNTVVFSNEFFHHKLISSPTASELGQFGQYNVGLFSGTMAKSIDLYDLKTPNFNLPITLNYSTNGFQVDKMASWVGYDWSLSTGGVITRLIRGEPDDKGTRIIFPKQLSASSQYNFSTEEQNGVISQMHAFDEEYDYEPDLYSFNFSNYRGMFYFDNNNTPVLINHQGLKISGSHMSIITITDIAGIIYEFIPSEFVRDPFGSGFYQTQDTRISFYLRKIIHPTGDEISFYYSPTSFAYATEIRHIKTYVSEPTPGQHYCTYDPGNSPNAQRIAQIITSVHLDSIVVKDGDKITFSKSTRLDSGEPRLSDMRIFNQSNELLKVIYFNHQFVYTDNYKSDLNVQAKYSNENFDEIHYRMFLNSIEISDKQEKKIQKYDFEYNNLQDLPIRLSYSKDHWGYFNGKSNSSLLPYSINAAYYFPGTNFGDRSPDWNFSRRGLLKKITYPTGGYSLIEYSQSMPNVGGVKVNKIISFTHNNDTLKVQRYEYIDPVTGVIWEDYYYTYLVARSGATPYITIHALTNERSHTLGSYGAPSVCYGKVRVYNGNDNNLGYEEHTFSINYDEPSIINDKVLGPNINRPTPMYNNSINNGEVQSIEYYKKVGNNYRRKRRVDYSYSEDSLKSFTNYFVRVRKTGTLPLVSSPNECGVFTLVQTELFFGIINLVFDVTKYGIISNWRYKSAEIITDYEDDGQSIINVLTKNFFYNNNIHTQITKTTVLNSNGDYHTTNFYYPHDYQLSSLNTLKQKNIIGIPLKIENLTDGKLIDGKVYNYNDFGQLIEEYTYESSELSTPPAHSSFELVPTKYKKTMQYSYNSSTRRLQEISKVNDITVSYIWGYKNALPIARIDNAKVNQTFYTSFEEDVVNVTTSDARTGHKSKLNGFSKSLTGLNSGQYILSYWQKSGGNWNYVQNNVSVSGSTYTISLSGQVDEVRFYPRNALMSTFTHMPGNGVTSTTDPTNITTYYDYDDFGRLKNTRDENKKLINVYDYHYKSF